MPIDNTVDIIGDRNLSKQLIDGSISSLVSEHTSSSLPKYVLDNCYGLRHIYLPNVSALGEGALRGCGFNELTLMDSFPNLTTAGNYSLCFPAFKLNLGNYNLMNSQNAYNEPLYSQGARIVESDLIDIQSNASRYYFGNITEILVLNNALNIQSYYSVNIPRLRSLVLKAQQVVSLSNSADIALSKTQIVNASSLFYGESYVYVPDNLVNDYKEATNWAVIQDKIKPISEFSEEHNMDSMYIQDSWEEIFENIANNNYSQYYKKKKLLLLNGICWGYVVCVGIDKDELWQNNGFAKTTWIFENSYGTYGISSYHYSGSDYYSFYEGTVGGYQYSKAKEFINYFTRMVERSNPTFFSHLVPVKKYTFVTLNHEAWSPTYSDYDNVVVESKETFWIPSYREIMGGEEYENIGVTYDDYFIDQTVRKKMSDDWSGLLGAETSIGIGVECTSYLLRTCEKNYVTRFKEISASGKASYTDVNSSSVNARLCLGFCLN